MRCFFPGHPVRTASAAILSLLIFVVPGSAQDWKTFTSDRLGYSIQYPPDWVSDIRPYAFDLYSDARREDNAGNVELGQAQIAVLWEDRGDINAIIASAAKHDPIFSQSTITSDIGNCKDVRNVLYRVIFPGLEKDPPQEDNVFYCGGNGEVVEVIVSYRVDDKNQERWRQTARKMLSTLRLQN